MFWIHCDPELGADSCSLLCQRGYGENHPAGANRIRSVSVQREKNLCIQQQQHEIIGQDGEKLRCWGKLCLVCITLSFEIC